MRAVVIVREKLAAEVLVSLHRVLSTGIAEMSSRIAEGRALVDVELFLNDHDDVALLIERVTSRLDGVQYDLHECVDGEEPSPTNQVTLAVLRTILAR